MVQKKQKPRTGARASKESGASYSVVPKLDKDVYRNLYAQYERWSIVKRQERLDFESKLSPAEAWQRYKTLWEYMANSMPPETELQAKQKALDIEHYLERIRTFEKKRRENPDSTRKTVTPSGRRTRKK